MSSSVSSVITSPTVSSTLEIRSSACIRPSRRRRFFPARSSDGLGRLRPRMAASAALHVGALAPTATRRLESHAATLGLEGGSNSMGQVSKRLSAAAVPAFAPPDLCSGLHTPKLPRASDQPLAPPLTPRPNRTICQLASAAHASSAADAPRTKSRERGELRAPERATCRKRESEQDDEYSRRTKAQLSRGLARVCYQEGAGSRARDGSVGLVTHLRFSRRVHCKAHRPRRCRKGTRNEHHPQRSQASPQTTLEPDTELGRVEVRSSPGCLRAAPRARATLRHEVYQVWRHV
eukprot:scaffold172735_cov35-Tisochrysis_lutea.AAC.6